MVAHSALRTYYENRMFPLVEEIGIEKFFFGVIKCLEHIEGLNLLQVVHSEV